MSDPDSDPLTVTLGDPPANGSLPALDPLTRTVRYTPAANFNGADSFTFRVSEASPPALLPR